MRIQTEVKHSEKQQKIRVCSVLLVEMEPVCFAPPPIKLLLCAQIFASLALPEVTATTGLGSASCCRHRERTRGPCFHQLQAHRLNCPNLSPLVCKQNSGPHLKESLGRKLQFFDHPDAVTPRKRCLSHSPESEFHVAEITCFLWLSCHSRGFFFCSLSP